MVVLKRRGLAVSAERCGLLRLILLRLTVAALVSTRVIFFKPRRLPVFVPIREERMVLNVRVVVTLHIKRCIRCYFRLRSGVLQECLLLIDLLRSEQVELGSHEVRRRPLRHIDHRLDRFVHKALVSRYASSASCRELLLLCRARRGEI